MRRTAAIALLALALATTAAAAPAGAATPRTTLPAIEEQVMCVVCKTPLAVANGPQADAERRQIRELIARGLTERQIKDALVAQYGRRVLALPDAGGFNAAVYAIPVAVVLLGLAILAVALPRWRRRAREPAPEAAWGAAPADRAPSAEELRRVDEELARDER
jgi:cytochrome c-type biogenesis protein CcmH/NrfF